jgi:2,3-bisphosphoglycerate-independent phosphoglycerate mutase
VVEVLVIPDGAAQPIRGERPTALAAAWTPVLDELAADGSVVRVTTTQPGLVPGSEVGIPSLLGCVPDAQIGRGRVDAAGHGIAVEGDLTPWRADLIYANGRRASVRQARDVARHLGPGARSIGGHRVLILARSRPQDRRILGLRLRVWEDGPPPRGSVPLPTTVICAPGAAAGCARLVGAEVVNPPRATGDVDTDLGAKLEAARAAAAAGAPRVVIHVGAPDEAAHRRDLGAVIGALEAIDAQLVGPLRELVAELGGRLVVCPDHGTDPVTGMHDASPVPALVWPPRRDAPSAERFSERDACAAPLLSPTELFEAVFA